MDTQTQVRITTAQALSMLEQFRSMKSGVNYRVNWTRDIKPLKTGLNPLARVSKICSAVVRTGINYDNMKTVKQGREDGTKPIENHGLPWGKWYEYPRLIEHKENLYLRFAIASEGFNHPVVTRFFLDGQPVERKDLVGIVSKSETDTKEMDSVFTLRLDSLVSLHKA